jgi:hypothetical protein
VDRMLPPGAGYAWGVRPLTQAGREDKQIIHAFERGHAGSPRAEIMRQSMKAGLSKVVEQFGRTPLKPLTEEEARVAYQRPNREFGDLERPCARLPKRRRRE